jgi:hypothetical protein
MYGFAATNKPKAIESNVRLACELKEKFSFVYAVRFLIIIYIYYSCIKARSVEKVAIKASTNTQSFSKLSMMFGSTTRRMTA